MNLMSHFIEQAVSRPPLPVLEERPPTPRTIAANKTLDQIVRHLREHGEMTTTQLATDFGWRTDNAHARLTRGMKMGRIVKEVRQSEDRKTAIVKIGYWRAA